MSVHANSSNLNVGLALLTAFVISVGTNGLQRRIICKGERLVGWLQSTLNGELK